MQAGGKSKNIQLGSRILDPDVHRKLAGRSQDLGKRGDGVPSSSAKTKRKILKGRNTLK